MYDEYCELPNLESPVGWALEYTNCISAESPVYDIKPSDVKAAGLEIWEMWNTALTLLPPGPLWLGVVAPNRVLSMDQIEQTVCKQMIDVKLWLLEILGTIWLCAKKSLCSFKYIIYKICLQTKYIFNIYV